MTRSRNWLTTAARPWLAALMVGSLAFATPALANGGARGTHHRPPRHHVDEVVAERDAAYEEIDRLKRRLARRPSQEQWADAQTRIADLESELARTRAGGGHRLRGRILDLEQQLVRTERRLAATEAELAETSRRAERRLRFVSRLQNRLVQAEAEIARLEGRLGYRTSHGYRRHRALALD